MGGEVGLGVVVNMRGVIVHNQMDPPGRALTVYHFKILDPTSRTVELELECAAFTIVQRADHLILRHELSSSHVIDKGLKLLRFLRIVVPVTRVLNVL